MDFTVYDIILLVSFVVFTSVFLYKRRKNLKKEGLLFLYKTSWGMKLIDKIGNKYKKTLDFLSYVSIAVGFLLMAAMIYLFGKLVWTYVFQSDIVQMVKVPPIMPLIPYLPQLFQLSFLPPFYFIYWIIILAVVAISHEFSHGIFAANKKIKIKSTGFGFFPYFLPVFLAAFVELDEKNMEKKKISSQMAILSAGTFMNVLVGILSLGILILFFSLAYTPSGVVFDTYTYSVIGLANISSINNLSVTNADYTELIALANETGFNKIEANGIDYLATKSLLEEQKDYGGYLILFDDAPAINANLSSTIVKINGEIVPNKEVLGEKILTYSPGDKVTITTLEDNDFLLDTEIILGKNPANETAPYLGIGFVEAENSGILKKIVSAVTSFKDQDVYYQPNFGAADVIYDLLWWLVLISFSVALVNMLPVGIFDGGKFFYLAILAITKSKTKAKKAFSIITYLFLALLAVIMVFWVVNMFK